MIVKSNPRTAMGSSSVFKIVTFLAFFMASYFAYSQETTVTGKVSTPTGEAISGATVQVRVQVKEPQQIMQEIFL